MTIMNLIKSDETKKAIKECNPSRIAVAYIGKDWRDFINPKNIVEIIISPTLGSNPVAIQEIATQLLPAKAGRLILP